jgi:hypothetical protein
MPHRLSRGVETSRIEHAWSTSLPPKILELFYGGELTLPV